MSSLYLNYYILYSEKHCIPGATSFLFLILMQNRITCKKAYDFSYAITDPKATDGFEPTIRELQSHALPLG